MFRRSDNILRSIPNIQYGYENTRKIFHEIWSIPQNIVMDMNIVMFYHEHD